MPRARALHALPSLRLALACCGLTAARRRGERLLASGSRTARLAIAALGFGVLRLTAARGRGGRPNIVKLSGYDLARKAG
ncbi:hypothetical protein [Paenibacillus thalictri]|uniref:Uncharacterized protein n=1 Tax=Paenibacillus thalictri TaxID=2527873 RepID=A0A4Q9DVB0_9BACL|nr:hypothetical protein [Paenibacillus thalictri]TBL79900.1 hypothetical protein EYB31_09930 [Paenibacillus thalictri]